MEDLQKIYNENNYPPKLKLYRLQINIYGLKYTKKQVDKFVESQEAYQLTKEVKKQEVFNSVVAPEIGSNYMVDLIIYDRFKIHNYQYILNCIDIKSRYAYGVPLTKKTTAAVIDGMKRIFRKMGHVPRELQMDNGGEFTSHEFQQAITDMGVKKFFYSDVGDIRKQSIVERHNKTLAMLLRYWREGSGEKTWYKVLDDIYELYNNSKHRTVKNKPIDIWKGIEENEQDITKVYTSLEPGDVVRRRIQKKVFDKGDTIQYTRETYTVMKKVHNKFVIINNTTKDELKRRYASDELLLVKDVIKSTTKDKKEIDDRIKQNATDNRVKKETNQLETVGHSSFMDSVKSITGKRKRKQKTLS